MPFSSKTSYYIAISKAQVFGELYRYKKGKKYSHTHTYIWLNHHNLTLQSLSDKHLSLSKYYDIIETIIIIILLLLLPHNGHRHQVDYLAVC